MKNRILYGIFLIVLSLCLICYFINAYVAISFPYDIDYGEGILLNQAKLFARGTDIYRDISNYPFLVGMYTPVYSLMSAFFVKLFGISFSIGRAISIVSAILIGFLIYKFNRGRTGREIALFSSLIFFASPYINTWTCLFRVDTLGLLFSLTGLYFVYKYENNKKVYIAVPFLLLSIYTKQSFIAAPIASFLYLFLKDKKRGLAFIGLFGSVALILFLIINYVTDGEFFLHAVAYNAYPFSKRMAILRYRDMISSHIILFGFASAYTINVLSKRERNLFVIYFILSALIALTVGKAGAVINYFLETIAASCILTGALWDELRSRIDRESLSNNLVLVLLLLQLVLFLHLPHTYWWRLGPDKAAAISNFKKISSYVKEAGDNILSQNASFIVLNDKTYLFQPYEFSVLQRQGLWDQSKLVKDIKAEKFSLILLYLDVNDENSFNDHRAFFTNEMRDAIRKGYYIVEKIGGTYIYMPESRRIKS